MTAHPLSGRGKPARDDRYMAMGCHSGWIREGHSPAPALRDLEMTTVVVKSILPDSEGTFS
jgi:hypothetical protein